MAWLRQLCRQGHAAVEQSNLTAGFTSNDVYLHRRNCGFALAVGWDIDLRLRLPMAAGCKKKETPEALFREAAPDSCFCIHFFV